MERIHGSLLSACLLLGLSMGAAAHAAEHATVPLERRPEVQAGMKDFLKTCPAQSANYRRVMGQDAEFYYPSTVSRLGLPGAHADHELASAAELKQKYETALADTQRIRSLYPAGTVWINQQMDAVDALNECMFRVGLRHAPGRAGTP